MFKYFKSKNQKRKILEGFIKTFFFDVNICFVTKIKNASLLAFVVGEMNKTYLNKRKRGEFKLATQGKNFNISWQNAFPLSKNYGLTFSYKEVIIPNEKYTISKEELEINEEDLIDKDSLKEYKEKWAKKFDFKGCFGTQIDLTKEEFQSFVKDYESKQNKLDKQKYLDSFYFDKECHINCLELKNIFPYGFFEENKEIFLKEYFNQLENLGFQKIDRQIKINIKAKCISPSEVYKEFIKFKYPSLKKIFEESSFPWIELTKEEFLSLFRIKEEINDFVKNKKD